MHTFSELYEYLDEENIIGEGCHGMVKLCKRKKDNKIFAVKIIRSGDE